MHPVRFKRVKKDGMPPDHELQVQHYIKQADRSYGLYSVLDPVSWEFHHEKVERNEEVLRRMIEAGEAFWNARLEEKFPVWYDDTGTTQERHDPGDVRCRKCQFRMTCQGAALFDAVPELADDELETLNDPILSALLVERDQLDVVLKDAKELKDGNSKLIREILGGPRKVLTSEGRGVYWINYTRHGLDTKALKNKYPKIAEEFPKDSPVNQLRIY